MGQWLCINRYEMIENKQRATISLSEHVFIMIHHSNKNKNDNAVYRYTHFYMIIGQQKPSFTSFSNQ